MVTTYLTHRLPSYRSNRSYANTRREPSMSCAAAVRVKAQGEALRALGQNHLRNRAPKGRQRSLVISGILFTNSRSPLRGSATPTKHYPRFAKPHPGLNSAAATQLIPPRRRRKVVFAICSQPLSPTLSQRERESNCTTRSLDLRVLCPSLKRTQR